MPYNNVLIGVETLGTRTVTIHRTTHLASGTMQPCETYYSVTGEDSDGAYTYLPPATHNLISAWTLAEIYLLEPFVKCDETDETLSDLQHAAYIRTMTMHNGE